MEINKDFKEFIQLLNQNEVAYLVVGGYAVAVYGFPRFTGDIDFWINPTSENAKKITRALTAFGFGAINFISLHHLRINKKASGRDKDLLDLKNLPEL